MTIKTLRDRKKGGQEDIWQYPDKIAEGVSKIDELEDVIIALREFERCLPHTDIDERHFTQQVDEIEEQAYKARELLALHGEVLSRAEKHSLNITSPVDTDEVNELIIEIFNSVESLRDYIGQYAAENEDGCLWMPWIDSENQVEKLNRAYHKSEEVHNHLLELDV